MPLSYSNIPYPMGILHAKKTSAHWSFLHVDTIFNEGIIEVRTILANVSKTLKLILMQLTNP